MRQSMTDDRLPPQDLDAEQAVLGACLVAAGAIERTIARLAVADFYREAHQRIYEAMRHVYDETPPVDLISVQAELRRRGDLEAVGGGEYLVSLIGSVPTAAHVTRYASEVARTAIAREAIRIGAGLQAAGYANPEDPGEGVAETIARLEALQERTHQSTRPRSVAPTTAEDTARIEGQRLRDYEVSTVRFGIPSLDKQIGGLEDAGFAVVKGDTSTGKSGLLRQICLSTAQEIKEPGRIVLLFALEECRWRWRRRSLAWMGRFDARALTNAVRWERERARRPALAREYEEATVAFASLPLHIASGDLSIGDIEAACKQAARHQDVALVLIDYVQEIRKRADAGNEEQAFREMGKRLVRLQDEIACPVITASQITKAPDGSRYTFGARAFEHAADTVISIGRERDEDGKLKPEATLGTDKTRELEPFLASVWTDFASGRWHDMTDARREQEVASMGGARPLPRPVPQPAPMAPPLAAQDDEDPFSEVPQNNRW